MYAHGMDIEWTEEEQHEKYFYEVVRQSVISLLAFICLYFMSYAVIRYLKKQRNNTLDDEEDTVYRISIWLCCFTMTVSFGAVLLLPFSIISNEVLLRYPHSYYVKWLNDSLIQGLWNQIFLGTYTALFLAMPFAYFFTESEGLAGSRKGIKARVYETFVVLILLGVLVLSLAWVIYGIFHKDNLAIDAWLPHLPFIYSCISLFGVLLQLLCAPLGFARLFSVLGQYVVKPQFLRDLDDEIKSIELQEESVIRQLKSKGKNGIDIRLKRFSTSEEGGPEFQILRSLKEEKRKLERERDASAWERNFLYPLCLLLLLALTAACLCMVALNSLSLLFMNGKLPFKNRLIANCIILLVLSSALPILARTLGITKFDLMGEYGKLNWLGNFHVVLFYNLVFEASTSLCLASKFTSTVRRALVEQMRQSPVFTKLTTFKLKVS